MDEILNIKTKFEIKTTEKKPAGAVALRIVSEAQNPFLKKAGDFFISQGEDGVVATFYTGDTFNSDTYRSLGGKIAAWIKATLPTSVFWEYDPKIATQEVSNLIEGLLLGSFEFDQYKKVKEIPNSSTLFLDTAFSELLAQRKIVCDAVNMARHWAHEPACLINPQTLSERIEILAKAYGLKCTVLDDLQLREMGAGAITAVGQGSKTPSRMIIVEYEGRKKEKPVVLVGKAITFDSGGYSIKPSDSMVSMKYDKCGAMAVLGVMRAAAELRFEKPIVGIICAAENMLSQNSYRPDDIIHSLSGQTIEVISTDAEGRLVLCDGLTYAQQKYDPQAIIDLATLTGGCVVAYGHVRAGVLCNQTELFDQLYASGEKTWERVWRLPHDEDYAELLKGTDADLKNSGGRWGSPVTGGMFLKQFVKDTIPWAHIDIAGVSDLEKGTAYSAPGATGFGIRLILDWLQKN